MTENIVNEKDREQTKKRLLNALSAIIEEDGFEKIGVNAIATKAGVSKILIYRYFGSVDDMIVEYLSENDFWINFSIDLPKDDNLGGFLKNMFRRQITELRSSVVMQRLNRWELIKRNSLIDKLRLKREAKAMTLVTVISQLAKVSSDEVAALATIMSSSITYLVLLSESCPIYNGIDLQYDRGWEQISKGMDLVIDMWFAYCDKSRQ